MTPSATPGFGAMCALHTDRTATRTCARCGNFMCDECALGGSELQCPTCRAKSGLASFPLTRGSLTFDGVWSYAFETWKREWVMLSIMVLIFGVGSIVGSVIGNVLQAIASAAVPKGNQVAQVAVVVVVQIIALLIGQVVNGVIQLGMFRVYFDVLTGQKADLARLITQLPKLGRYIVQVLIIGLLVGVPLVLFLGVLFAIGLAIGGGGLSHFDIDHPERLLRDSGPAIAVVGAGLMVAFIPLLWVMLPLQLAVPELVLTNAGAWECIRRSFVLAKDFRLLIFGSGLVGGLVVLVGLVACCVGALPAVALQQLIISTLYLGLRNGSGLPEPEEASTAAVA